MAFVLGVAERWLAVFSIAPVTFFSLSWACRATTTALPTTLPICLARCSRRLPLLPLFGGAEGYVSKSGVSGVRRNASFMAESFLDERVHPQLGPLILRCWIYKACLQH